MHTMQYVTLRNSPQKDAGRKDAGAESKTDQKNKAKPDIAKIVGPGYWDFMHRISYGVKTKIQRDFAIASIKKVSEDFPCMRCRKEFQKQLAREPLHLLKPEYDENGYDISVFKYLWIAHNRVNERLHKPVVDLDVAIMKYSPTSVCLSDCGDEEESSKHSKEGSDADTSEASEARNTGEEFI